MQHQVHSIHHTCTECELSGTSAKYWGESSANAYERAKQHLTDANAKKSSSHMHQHMIMAHPGITEYDRVFRFDVVEAHSSAFTRQLAEAIQMKNSQAVMLNLKDECTRCIIPDIKLEDRGWKVGGPQRKSSKFEGEPKLIDNARKQFLRDTRFNHDSQTTDGELIHKRRQRIVKIRFKKIKKKRH